MKVFLELGPKDARAIIAKHFDVPVDDVLVNESVKIIVTKENIDDVLAYANTAHTDNNIVATKCDGQLKQVKMQEGMEAAARYNKIQTMHSMENIKSESLMQAPVSEISIEHLAETANVPKLVKKETTDRRKCRYCIYKPDDDKESEVCKSCLGGSRFKSSKTMAWPKKKLELPAEDLTKYNEIYDAITNEQLADWLKADKGPTLILRELGLPKEQFYWKLFYRIEELRREDASIPRKGRRSEEKTISNE